MKLYLDVAEHPSILDVVCIPLTNITDSIDVTSQAIKLNV